LLLLMMKKASSSQVSTFVWKEEFYKIKNIFFSKTQAGASQKKVKLAMACHAK